MHTSLMGKLSRILLIVSLFAGLAINSGAAAASGAAPAAPLAVSAGATFPPITIPTANVTPTIDGVCSINEYGTGTGAAGYSFLDTGGASATVNLMHDNTWLYVCMVAPQGTNAARFASLYLDPQGNGISYTYAQQDDYSLRINIVNSTQSSFQGSGVINGWVSDPAIASYWNGAASSDGKYDYAEYRINLKDFGISLCSTIFGMAVYHHWVAATGDDYGWPSNQWFDQPRTWQLVTLGGKTCGTAGTIAYVFNGNVQDATSFYTRLTEAGYSVTLVPLSSVVGTDFSAFTLTIIADDTGSLNQWGTSGSTAAQVAAITSPDKPIIGLGEGGYAFFGQLSMYIGWPRGWHGPQSSLNRAASAPTAIFTGVTTSDPVPYTSAFVNSVGIYLKNPTPPAGVTPYALEDPLDDHASLIQEGCRVLWGNSGNPLVMTGDGQTIFINTVGYIASYQCPAAVTTPPPTCYFLSKSASPASGTAVSPGDVITYTLKYQLIANPGCPASAKLVDVVPAGTTFVPGSTGDGTAPDGGGVLTWLVGTSGSVLTKTFQVTVSDNVCAANGVVSNSAELRFSGASPLDSNTVTNPVNCPPVGLSTSEPMFAETELKVEPYPLVAGTPSKVSVQLQNLTAAPLTVTVQFQWNPAAQFGIGLAYTTFATAGATLPASGVVVLTSYFTPTFSGNGCIQASVTATGMSATILTQTCLDVTEHLTPGTPASWVVPVRNNTASPAAITLVVDNTCPGWSAAITDPASGITGTLPAGAPQNVTVQVTPPATGLLGTGCHIDLQAWIGTTMIGGVRKLDLAPVHLPPSIQPPWEEPEITVRPDPAAPGTPAQLCIQLVNPLPTSQIVSVDFSVADFGAGIGFTPAGSLSNITIPANSIGTYCINWTPSAGGTLHRCVLATLRQAGYVDQTSQHNFDLVNVPAGGSLEGLSIPFVVGNPDLVPHTVTFDVFLIGIPQPWTANITGGGTLAASIPAGGLESYQLTLTSLGGPKSNLLFVPFGSQSSIQVIYLLDGTPAGGFTIVIAPRTFFLPVLRR